MCSPTALLTPVKLEQRLKLSPGNDLTLSLLAAARAQAKAEEAYHQTSGAQRATVVDTFSQLRRLLDGSERAMLAEFDKFDEIMKKRFRVERESADVLHNQLAAHELAGLDAAFTSEINRDFETLITSCPASVAPRCLLSRFDILQKHLLQADHSLYVYNNNDDLASLQHQLDDLDAVIVDVNDERQKVQKMLFSARISAFPTMTGSFKGRLVTELTVPYDADEYKNAFAVSSDGRVLAAACFRTSDMKVFDILERKLIQTFNLGKFIPADTRFTFTFGRDLHHIVLMYPTPTISGHCKSQRVIEVSLNRRRNVEYVRDIALTSSHKECFTILDINASGNLMVFGGTNSWRQVYVDMYGYAKGNMLGRLQTNTFTHVTDLAISHDTSHVAVSGYQGREETAMCWVVQLFSTRDGSVLRTYTHATGQFMPTLTVSFSPYGEILVLSTVTSADTLHGLFSLVPDGNNTTKLRNSKIKGRAASPAIGWQNMLLASHTNAIFMVSWNKWSGGVTKLRVFE